MNRRSRHLIVYAAAMLALMIWQVLFSVVPTLARLSDYHGDIVYSLVAEGVCMGIIPLLLLTLLSRGRVKDNIRLMRYKAPRDKVTCLLVTLGLMALITPFTMAFNAIGNLILNILGYKRAYPAGTIYLGVGDLFLALAVTAVLPALCEEFTHRGVLMTGLEYRGSELSAILLSSVLFGLMHENPTQMIYATFGGLMFGYVVIKTDSIFPAICVHFANNAVSVLLDYSTQRQNALGVWYDKMTSSSSALSVGITFLVLALSLYGVYRLLQYAARKADKPISERKLLGILTVDGYNPEGKATLKDNALLYATMIAESAALLFLLLWGILK